MSSQSELCKGGSVRPSGLSLWAFDGASRADELAGYSSSSTMGVAPLSQCLSGTSKPLINSPVSPSAPARPCHAVAPPHRPAR